MRIDEQFKALESAGGVDDELAALKAAQGILPASPVDDDLEALKKKLEDLSRERTNYIGREQAPGKEQNNSSGGQGEGQDESAAAPLIPEVKSSDATLKRWICHVYERSSSAGSKAVVLRYISNTSSVWIGGR